MSSATVDIQDKVSSSFKCEKHKHVGNL